MLKRLLENLNLSPDPPGTQCQSGQVLMPEKHTALEERVSKCRVPALESAALPSWPWSAMKVCFDGMKRPIRAAAFAYETSHWIIARPIDGQSPVSILQAVLPSGPRNDASSGSIACLVMPVADNMQWTCLDSPMSSNLVHEGRSFRLPGMQMYMSRLRLRLLQPC